MPQDFTTTDLLTLELRDDPITPAGDPHPHLHNYVKNGDGKWGGWFWLSPVADTVVINDFGALGFRTRVAQSGVYFTTELMPRRAGATHTRAYALAAIGHGSPGLASRLRIEYLDDDGTTVLSTSPASPLIVEGTPDHMPATAIPAAAKYLRLRLDLERAGGPALLAFDTAALNNITLIQGTLAELEDPDGFRLDDGWVDVLGPSLEVRTSRDELNLGTLTATIYGPELDPSTADTIRAGKEVRLMVDVITEGDRQSLFTGEVLNATVTYDLLHPDPFRRTKITLNAVDRVRTLGNVPRPDGVASLGDLPYVLEGCGLPWNVNGNDGHAETTPVVVAHNEAAKAIDQLVITRDSNLAYAWVDRAGVVQAWDNAELEDRSPRPFFPDLDEDVYADVAVDYDTDRCINIVGLTYLRLDPTTGTTEEIPYGPYVDLASREEWGPHEQTFTVQGIAEDAATLEAYAAAILAANATPQRRLNKATIYLRDEVTLGDWALLDLYDVQRLSNARADIAVGTKAIVTGVSHTITAGEWKLEASFAATGGVAIPQAVPSPPPTAAKTLAELLRPVGEVTMFYGLPSAVPAGWLVLAGGTFDPVAYPALEEFLGTNVLPDFTDRIPVGAGVKALGAASGSWTRTITAAQLPPHTHPILRGSDEGTSGTRVKRSGNTTVADAPTQANASGTGGAADPVDITPRVLALYLMIRAVAGVPT